MIEDRKKLIQAILPLEAINEGYKPETETHFSKGHPRSVHNWWARTPLSVCRAVLFAQFVDDPDEGLNADKADVARESLKVPGAIILADRNLCPIVCEVP